jgi:hypothetical protein
MPLKYTWTRTVIAGQGQPYGLLLPRQRAQHRPGLSLSSERLVLGDERGRAGHLPDQVGDERRADTKDEAAAMVERCYDACRVG